MAVEVTIPKEAHQEAGEAEKLLQLARDYKIDSPQTMNAAAQDLLRIKNTAKDLENRRKLITKPLDEAKARVMDFFRGPLQFLTDAERLIKLAMLDYQAEQDRKAREEEARLRDLARKEQEKLQARAAKLEEKGQTERAEALREAAESFPVPHVAPAVHRPVGISSRETWSAEVVDIKALCKAVADGVVPEIYIEPNMTALNSQARALKEHMKIPGVEAKSTKSIAAGGR